MCTSYKLSENSYFLSKYTCNIKLTSYNKDNLRKTSQLKGNKVSKKYNGREVQSKVLRSLN